MPPTAVAKANDAQSIVRLAHHLHSLSLLARLSRERRCRSLKNPTTRMRNSQGVMLCP
jgi:hypothetical protein